MKTRFTEVKYGIALFTEIETKAIPSNDKESRIIDTCSWKTIQASYPDFKVISSYDDWKEATLMGMNFALKLLKPETGIEISLVDINGHDVHSNIYSMFMAGVLAVFKEYSKELKEEGIEKLKGIARVYSKDSNIDPISLIGMGVEEFRAKYVLGK